MTRNTNIITNKVKNNLKHSIEEYNNQNYERLKVTSKIWDRKQFVVFESLINEKHQINCELLSNQKLKVEFNILVCNINSTQNKSQASFYVILLRIN